MITVVVIACMPPLAGGLALGVWMAVVHLRHHLRSKRFDRHAATALDVGSSTASGVPYVQSNHPQDCAEKCCWEIRLTELHDAVDWGAYEHEMRKTK